MKLVSLLRLLGLRELARRAGVAEATIRRWQRSGPSSRGQDILDAIAARRRAAQKAVRTKKKRTAFRATLPVPVGPLSIQTVEYRHDFDDPTDLVPNRPPVETKAALRRVASREGHDLGGGIDTDYNYGESVWLTIGQPLVEVDLDWVGDTVVQIWQQSSRTWVQVQYLFFRYIPFNPLYRGEMLAKQGKWHEWWASMPGVATMTAFSAAFPPTFEAPLQSAESRLIWLEGCKVRTYEKRVNRWTRNKRD